MREKSSSARRVFRWVGLSVLVLLVGAIAAHAVWRYASGRALRQSVAALERAGEPTRPADLAPQSPDGPDNAAQDLCAGWERIDASAPAWEALHRQDLGLPLRPDERQAIEAALAAFGAAFTHVESAQGKPRCDWYLGESDFTIGAPLPQLNGSRRLASLLAAAAVLDHEKGDDASAVRRLEQVVFLSRCMGRFPTMIGHLVSHGLSAMAASRAVELAPDLRIGTDAGAASPQQIGQLIGLLLDDRPPMESYRLGLRAERVMAVAALEDTLNGSAGSQSPGLVRRYFIRPMWNDNQRVIADHLTGMVQSAGAPDLPTARAGAPVLPAGVANGSTRYVLASMLLGSTSRMTETQYRNMTDRRLAAAALAVRWYAAEHDGRLPARLDDLVPRYLSTMPADPMLAAPAILRYTPDRPRPMLYSAGTDGTDDGGDDTPIKQTATIAGEWARRDRVVDLKRQPRPAPQPEE